MGIEGHSYGKRCLLLIGPALLVGSAFSPVESVWTATSSGATVEATQAVVTADPKPRKYNKNESYSLGWNKGYARGHQCPGLARDIEEPPPGVHKVAWLRGFNRGLRAGMHVCQFERKHGRKHKEPEEPMGPKEHTGP